MSKIVDGVIADIKKIPQGLKTSDGKIDYRKILINYVPYIAIAYVTNKISYAFRIEECGDFWIQLMNAINHVGAAFKNPFPSFNMIDILIGIAGGVAFKLIVVYKRKNSKQFRKGEEYGSAKWGSPEDVAPLMDPVFERNMILTKTEGMRMIGRASNPIYERNKNVLVVGANRIIGLSQMTFRKQRVQTT